MHIDWNPCYRWAISIPIEIIIAIEIAIAIEIEIEIEIAIAIAINWFTKKLLSECPRTWDV